MSRSNDHYNYDYSRSRWPKHHHFTWRGIGKKNKEADVIGVSVGNEQADERGAVDGDAADDAVYAGVVLEKPTAQERETMCSTARKTSETFETT